MMKLIEAEVFSIPSYFVVFGCDDDISMITLYLVCSEHILMKCILFFEGQIF